MINQFSGNAVVPPPPPSVNSQPISEEKTARLNEILSDYDAENLSDDDALNIVSQIKELGIEPGAGLAKVMADTGFDAQSVREQAGVNLAKDDKNGSPPPPTGRKSVGPEPISGYINKDAMIALESLIESYEMGSLTSENWMDIRSSMSEQGFDLSQPVMDIRA